MYQRQGKYTLAETYVAQTLAGRRHALGSEHPDTMASVADLALAEVSEGRFAESEPLAREALDTNSKIQPGNWQRFRAESLLGASLAGEKKYTQAEPMLLKAIKGCWLERTLWPSPINTTSNWHGDGLSRSTKTGASLTKQPNGRKNEIPEAALPMATLHSPDFPAGWMPCALLANPSASRVMDKSKTGWDIQRTISRVLTDLCPD